MDIVAIDDQAPADTDEQVAFGAQLITDLRLHLTQMEREHPRLVVGLHQVAIVAVR